MVHFKKRLSVKNKTHYFDPSSTRVKNEVVSPKTYFARASKIEGYENRLYWEYKYCQDHYGQVFYYTLTYNDRSIPQYMGKNCFDYNDLRELLNGAFVKRLKRDYGTRLKYFVGAELGDGKGSRGLHNNPHYHVLFFLTPLQDKDGNFLLDSYSKISPREFRHLVYMYWQGFDQTDGKYYDYRLAKKGIAKEGDNLGLVNSFRACVYCAKYVCKDISLVKHEDEIRKQLRLKYIKNVFREAASYEGFWFDYIVPKYNIPISVSTDSIKLYKWTDRELYYRIKPAEWSFKVDDLVVDYSFSLVQALNLQSKFYQYCEEILEDKISDAIAEYRNRYCNKCRISHGVGDYALDFIDDKLNPSIQIPSKEGFKNRPIGLYYYRKLFTDVKKDKMGNPSYVLNQAGINYKANKIFDSIIKLSHDTFHLVTKLNEDIFNDMRSSSINTNCFLYWNDIKNVLQNESSKEFLRRACRSYAEFKLVYQNRFFKIQPVGYPVIDIINDYKRFISPVHECVDYRVEPVSTFLEKSAEGYLAYDSHPYFHEDCWLYPLFDLVSDYTFIQEDDKKQETAEQIAATRRFHSKFKVDKFVHESFRL